MLAHMAGRPRTRAAQQKAALEQLRAIAAQDEAAHVEAMTPDDFGGHNPPRLPDDDEAAQLLSAAFDQMDAGERTLALHDLWQKAVLSAERILDDDDASAAAKASVIRLIGDVRKKELEEQTSKLPTRIIFETAAYAGDAA